MILPITPIQVSEPEFYRLSQYEGVQIATKSGQRMTYAKLFNDIPCKRLENHSKNLRELFTLISENPDLPILAWVDSEVVADDGYGRWLASWGSSGIIEYIMVEMYNDYPEMIEKDDTEQYEEFLYDTTEMTDQEIEEHIKNIDWIKAIVVYIDLP